MEDFVKHLVILTAILTCLSSVAVADEATFLALKDTDLWSTDPGTNGGDWIWFDLRGGVGTEERARSLVQFDIQPVMGTNVGLAVLRLYAISEEWYLSGGHAEIYRAADAWDELSVTWNNQPAENKDIRSVQTLPPPNNTWAELEVTDIVQSWADSSFENNGFFLAIPDSTPEAFIGFASRDTSDTTLHPRLYVEYSTVNIEEPEKPSEPGIGFSVVNNLSNVGIKFNLTHPSPVSLKVYDATGAVVETLFDGMATAGNHHFVLNCRPGVYFARLETTGCAISGKAVVF
jgi:hypothetical protein